MLASGEGERSSMVVTGSIPLLIDAVKRRPAKSSDKAEDFPLFKWSFFNLQPFEFFLNSAFSEFYGS